MPGDQTRVAVIVAVETYTGYQRQIIRGVAEYARRHRPSWDLRFDHRPGIPRGDRVRQFPEAAAAIFHGGNDPDLLAALREMGGPAVAAGQRVDGFPTVMPDEAAVGRLACEHLRGKGFARLAYLGPVPRGTPADAYGPVFHRRHAAFAKAAADSAGESDVLLPPPTLRDATIAAARPRGELVGWVASLPPPCGLFCGNIGLAREAVTACRAAGVAVPEQVAVLGVDHDDLFCDLVEPPLSTIDHGMERVGYEAAALLARIMAGEHDGSPRTLTEVPPVGVEQRRSTDTLAIEDEDVRRAMRLIHDRALDGLTAADVVAAVPAGRRTLEMRFRRLIGRPIKREILRRRVEHAKLLLSGGEMKLPEVAAHCGFNYASRLTVAFRNETGTTPSEYRRRSRPG